LPLFNYQCESCAAVCEVLTNYESKAALSCALCGGASKRHAISLFRIGAKPRINRKSLSATGADFISSPDSFVSAMDTFGDKIGDRLTGPQMEKAVEQLKQAKR
jgi:hypothetical protein